MEGVEENALASMKALFDIFDSSGDGMVQANEVGAVLRRLNLVKSRKMVQTIIEIVDIDGDGEISFPEFVTLMGRVKQEVDEPAFDPEAELGEQDIPAQLTVEEKAAKAERQAAMFAFQRAVTMMAFKHLSNDDDKTMAELLGVLQTEPLERSEWDLQRLLIWAENYKGNGFAFINELDPPEVSDVRIEVCRCMTVQCFKAGDVICKQGTEGDSMYVVMLGELDVLGTGPDGVSELHLAFKEPGTSVGELAVMGEDKSDTLRTATLKAYTDCVVGVLSRKDYRRHILRMQIEAKAELVEKLAAVLYLSRVGKNGLLRMAMMLKPVRFARGDEIARQGVLPTEVTFLTSGSAMVVVHVTDGQHASGFGGIRQKLVEVVEQYFDRSLETVGATIAGDEPEVNRWGLRATTVCEGWRIAPNVAKRVLGKQHVLEGMKEHLDTIDRMIADRVVQSSAGDKVRASLGFPSAKAKATQRSPRVRRNGSDDLEDPQPTPPLFSKPVSRNLPVTPRNLLRPGQTSPSAQKSSGLAGTGWKAAPVPPLRVLPEGRSPPVSGGGSVRTPLVGKSPLRQKSGTQSARQYVRPAPVQPRRTAIQLSLMPVSRNGPHATRIEQQASTVLRELGKRKPAGGLVAGVYT